jgi:hypothetical protein
MIIASIFSMLSRYAKLGGTNLYGGDMLIIERHHDLVAFMVNGFRPVIHALLPKTSTNLAMERS